MDVLVECWISPEESLSESLSQLIILNNFLPHPNHIIEYHHILLPITQPTRNRISIIIIIHRPKLTISQFIMTQSPLKHQVFTRTRHSFTIMSVNQPISGDYLV